MFWLRNKENIFFNYSLIWSPVYFSHTLRPDLIYSLNANCLQFLIKIYHLIDPYNDIMLVSMRVVYHFLEGVFGYNQGISAAIF